MSTDPWYLAGNRASLERLRSLVASLSDDDLAQSVGGGWTVAVALAHLAFWDRRSIGLMERWEREGYQYVPVDSTALNAEMLPTWLAIDPREAALEAIAAAEAVDAKVAQLPQGIVDAMLAAGRRISVDRSIHREEHIQQIELALER